MPECPECAAEVLPGSRYCQNCGRPLPEGASVPTAIRFRRADPALIVAAVIAVGGLVLLARGVVAWAVVAFLAAAVTLLAARQVDSRTAARTLASFRSRAAATGEAVAARSREQVELFRARRELAELEADRNRFLRDLGAAAYARDDAGIAAALAAVDGVVARIAAKEAEVEALRRETEERVHRAHAQSRPTEKLE